MEVEMHASAPKIAPNCPKSSHVVFDGRKYALTFEAGAWRLRSRSRRTKVDHRTGLANLTEAKKAAREWLAKHAENPVHSRKGGGSLAALVEVYKNAPKRAGKSAEKVNISRLRSICRLVLGRELHDVTCREANPELWEKYQRKALAEHGLPFNYSTRYRQNISINSAVHSATNLFIAAMLPRYRAEGLDVRPDAQTFVKLPEPYVPPTKVDDAELVKTIRAMARDALWMAVATARFAGLRCREIAAMRGTWIEEEDGAIFIRLMDRPEEGWWRKTNVRPYRAQVLDADLAEVLRAKKGSPELVIEAPEPRDYWFTHEPQGWLKRHGVDANKPLHRLRGLYADHLAKLTTDAVAARLAGVRAAQEALGHASPKMTETHYLSQ